MNRGTTRASLPLLALFLCSSCAWHDVDPRLGPPPQVSITPTIGLAAADEETALTDLQGIARRGGAWGATRIVFPYRVGDPVDVLVVVRLRQTSDTHQVENIFRGIAVGGTLFLLSPVIGGRFTEIHDVEMWVSLQGRVIGTHRFRMDTDMTAGMMADAHAAAKDLDDEQINRIAKRILELVAADISAAHSTQGAAHAPTAADPERRAVEQRKPKQRRQPYVPRAFR
ncbi:MAG TPA: hypothetical protein VM686_15585 [Polyangiaceae bacterium]|nr:hypothetical protein [Polyangiaceae bacterium]